ncbi:MAG: glycosyl hydrolase-related protein [Chloroflexota bacterium]|nr:glycosyl hydrolase-related protein [Chloroflexota bacterium]
MKRAENGDGIIVRLYESQRKRGQVKVQMGCEVEAAWETNLLEENKSALSMENGSIQLNLKPYHIMTMRVILKSDSKLPDLQERARAFQSEEK